MAVTLGSTGITFPDATTQTTAATGGGGTPQATFTAASNITAGNVVQFTTGTNVEAVAGNIYTQSVAGSNTILSGNIANGSATVAYDPNTPGSFVACSVNSSGNVVVQAGTTSNNTTTVGTAAVSAIGGSSGGYVKAMFDPVTAGKGMVIFYNNSASKSIHAVIFTVSGTTATIQSTTTLTSSTSASGCSFSYYGQDRFVFTYHVTTVMYAKACSISTYTITQGAQTSIATALTSLSNTSQPLRTDIDYSRTTTNVLGAIGGGSVILMSVNPSTLVITAGAKASFGGGATAPVTISFDPFVNTRLAIGSVNLPFYSVRGFSITPSTLTVGSNNSWYVLEVTTSGISPYYTVVKFLDVKDSVTKSVLSVQMSEYGLIGCVDQTTFSFTTLIAETSAYNSAITASTPTQINSLSTNVYYLNNLSLVSGQSGKVSLVYPSTLTTSTVRFGQSKVAVTNFVPANVIGIANASASSSASVVVNVFGGVDTHQTGLTTNSTYYVTQAGVLTTTSTSPNLLMGRAVSSTSILIKGLAI